VTCANGHESPDDQDFCGECGIPTVPGMVLCAHGHINPGHHKFCGDCGAPIVPPVAADSAESTGRWTVDPTCKHQFRYRVGNTWTQHVADIGDGTFSVDPPPRARRSYTETWVGIAAGVVIVVLIVGAISATAISFSGNNKVARETINQPQQAVLPPAAVPPAQYPPAPSRGRPLAVIGGSCPADSINGVTTDGSTAYCELLPDTNTYMWSVYPGAIDSPYPPGTDPSQREDPGIAVCMAQTQQSRTQCDADLP
jgi:hypothetical protein